MTGMDGKERFDALMALAEFRRNIRDIRNNLEWKVTISIWTFLIAAAVTLAKYDAIVLIFFSFIAIVLHSFWMFRNYVVQSKDAVRMENFHDEAAKLIYPDYSGTTRRFSEAEEVRWWHGFSHQPCMFQLAVTSALVAADVVVALST